MGAFLLFKPAEKINEKKAKLVFSEKGFGEPKEFALTDMKLWLYTKQLIAEPNYIISENKNALFAVGTLVYKGKNYQDSLLALLRDFEGQQIDYEDIIGAFCLIFHVNNRIYIMLDQGNIYNIFTNTSNTILSSSFLALAASHPGQLSINRMALLEQLLVGYITAPDTSVNEINLVNHSFQRNSAGNSVQFLSYSGMNDAIDIPDFKSAVNRQLHILSNYYQQIALLAQQHNTDIGLSGGYDSRLNFLLADKSNIPFQVHTHRSSEHKTEMYIAKMLADSRNLQLKSIILPQPDKMSDDKLKINLLDSYFYYDGRTNKTMGTYKEEHTRKYRLKILNNAGLGLNGLGGEIYRNYNYTCMNRLNFADWIKYQVLNPFSTNALINKNELNNFLEYIVSKYELILQRKNIKYFDRYASRKFYIEIWLPYAASVKCKAENQLSFFLMPFTEYRITREALHVTPFIGLTAKLEAEMMIQLDQQVAGLPSSYGFGFDNEPFKYKLISFLKCHIPNGIKNYINSYRLKKNYSHYDWHKYSQGHLVNDTINQLMSYQLPVNWNIYFADRCNFDRAVSIGYALSQLDSCVYRMH